MPVRQHRLSFLAFPFYYFLYFYNYYFILFIREKQLQLQGTMSKSARSNVELLVDLLAASLAPEAEDLNVAMDEEDQESRAAKAALVQRGPMHDTVARAILRGRCPDNATSEMLTAIAHGLVGGAIDARHEQVHQSTSRHRLACRPYATAYTVGHLSNNPLAPLLDELPKTIHKDSPIGLLWHKATKEIPKELNALLRSPCPVKMGPILLFARRAALLELLAPLLAAELDSFRPPGTTKKTPVPVAKQAMKGSYDELDGYI